jgi:hypothetical protein
MMSAAARAARRGGRIFTPPDPSADGWHEVQTHMGVKTLQWRAGIEVWRDAMGQRWTAELAGDLVWRYIGPADLGGENPTAQAGKP